MILCMRCGRKMKHASASGYGPKCEIAVLGPRTKPKRVKAEPVRRDAKTRDLFEGVAA